MTAQLQAGMFTSASEEWATPLDFFGRLDAEFSFTLDAAASAENAKCSRYYTKDDDGLAQSWAGETVWCNPPYGRQIGQWVQKGFEAASLGATTVLLIPARTDTAYWHDYAMRASEVRLVRSRLQFVSDRALSNAPFPSAVVVFRPGDTTPRFSSFERGIQEQPRIDGRRAS